MRSAVWTIVSGFRTEDNTSNILIIVIIYMVFFHPKKVCQNKDGAVGNLKLCGICKCRKYIV